MATRDEVTKVLERLKSRNSEEFESLLSDRKRDEAEFHDRGRNEHLEWSSEDASFETRHGNRKFYIGTRTSRHYVRDWISSNSKGKVFLDYACGNGDYAIFAAQSGAALSIGLDISRISVENAKRAAILSDINNVDFYQGDCEDTGLPSTSVDIVICSGMLHHLDLTHAFPELYRILKPGGRILCIEALNYNPAIRLYRRLTPAMRTAWEKDHILSYKDIR